MKKKAIIISIKGFTLGRREKEILKKENPWGLILFKRNIKNFIQLKNTLKPLCENFVYFGSYYSKNIELP